MRELGLKVYPSQTNFVLLELDPGDKNAASCADFLARHGISVRRFASPAYRDCIRVTIGYAANMVTAEQKIAEFLER